MFGRAALLAACACAMLFPALSHAETSASTATTAPPSAAVVEGFRSARFGMDEDAVRAAIKADFGLEDAAIEVGQNTAERTRVMAVTVPGVLPDGGAAQVSYIFGYASKSLIQIGLLWSTAVDPSLTEDMIYANGDTLRAHFEAAGYQPDTITRDAVVDAGILLFRGSDAQGRTVILLLQGSFAEADGKRTLTPTGLTLLYAENPDNPDILKLKSEDF